MNFFIKKFKTTELESQYVGNLPMQFIKPMLATLVDEPFDNPDWIFEIKWDGYRAIAEIDHGSVNLYSRNNQSFLDRFKPVANDLAKLPSKAILDGEIVVLDEQGMPSFQKLQNYTKTQTGNLIYYLFDVLVFEGKDIRNLPLIERKKILRKLIKGFKHLKYCDHVLETGKSFFRSAAEKGLEGIIGKNMNSPYIQGRSKEWVKIKAYKQQEAIICGFTEPKGSRKGFGSLILGAYKNHELVYIGHAGTGFDEKKLSSIHNELLKIVQPNSPFKTKLKEKATWVKPKLICEVKFSDWTDERQMRHPVFIALREDKKPSQVGIEKSLPLESVMSENSPILSNLNKIFWPKEGYTKGDLIEYYKQVSSFILPYLSDRPESLHRFPEGIEDKGFFQKNAAYVPEWVRTHKIEQDGKIINYIVIDDVESLIYAVNLGCIEINPFNSRIESLQNPDYMIIDLDPVDIAFEKVVETARVVHELLEEIEVPSFCKTSGATGLHIYVPMGAKFTYEQVKEFGRIITYFAFHRIPDITSLERSPSKRRKRVYLDYLQNNFGQTVASAYCVRPYPGAPVSTPLKWSEVKKGLNPLDFTIKTIMKRLDKVEDLFKPVLGKGIDLKKILANLERKYF